MKESFHILLVEDEKVLRDALQHALSQAQYHVTAVSSALQARETIKENKFDIAIMDIRLPDGNGIELLREFRHLDQDLRVIITTGYAEIDIAIDAIRLGASDFIRKPFDIDELLIRIEETLKSRSLTLTNRELNKQVQTMHSQETLIGQSESIVRIRKTIELLSESESNVLITGDTGTGKEVVARLLHTLGSRSRKPFVPVNCGAIPEELLESELFGHVKGSFTGAIRNRLGRFELANGGSIFLDEIGDMSQKLQVKLLRVLQERSFEPVGSNAPVQVNVRVIAATHRNLEEEIKAGQFREDLYYRLNVIPLHIAPLCERNSDILLLAKHFMNFFNSSKQSGLTGFSSKAEAIMMSYQWPGNVRELQNVMERISTLKAAGCIEVNDLPSKMLDQAQRIRSNISASFGSDEEIDLKNMVEEFENELIVSALNRFNWNKNRTAQFLSLKRTTLVEKIKKKNLNPENHLH